MICKGGVIRLRPRHIPTHAKPASRVCVGLESKKLRRAVILQIHRLPPTLLTPFLFSELPRTSCADLFSSRRTSPLVAGRCPSMLTSTGKSKSGKSQASFSVFRGHRCGLGDVAVVIRVVVVVIFELMVGVHRRAPRSMSNASHSFRMPQIRSSIARGLSSLATSKLGSLETTDPVWMVRTHTYTHTYTHTKHSL
jgi:hypothetical protein